MELEGYIVSTDTIEGSLENLYVVEAGDYLNIENKPAIDGHELMPDSDAHEIGLARLTDLPGISIQGLLAGLNYPDGETVFQDGSGKLSVPLHLYDTSAEVDAKIKAQADITGQDIDRAKNQAINNARSYTDTQVTQARTDLQSYADSKASTALKDAKSYTDGQIVTAKKESNSYTDSQVSSAKSELLTELDSRLVATFKPQGSSTFAKLPTPSKANLGYVYNVTDAFVTTAAFKEGAGHSLPAGTNVYVYQDGSTYGWDSFAGEVDLSPLTAAIESKQDQINFPGNSGYYLNGNGQFTKPPDTTYGVVSKTSNGLAPKLSGVSTQYLNGLGQWTTPQVEGGVGGDFSELESKINEINDYTTGINLLRGTRDVRPGKKVIAGTAFCEDGFGGAAGSSDQVYTWVDEDGYTVITMHKLGLTADSLTSYRLPAIKDVKPGDKLTLFCDLMVEDLSAYDDKLAIFYAGVYENGTNAIISVSSPFGNVPISRGIPSEVESGVWTKWVWHITIPEFTSSAGAYLAIQCRTRRNGVVNYKRLGLVDGHINNPIWFASPFDLPDLSEINDCTTGINLLRGSRDCTFGNTLYGTTDNLRIDGSSPNAKYTQVLGDDGFTYWHYDGSSSTATYKFLSALLPSMVNGHTLTFSFEFMIEKPITVNGMMLQLYMLSLDSSSNGSMQTYTLSQLGFTASELVPFVWYKAVCHYDTVLELADNQYIRVGLTGAIGGDLTRIINFRKYKAEIGHINDPIYSQSPLDVLTNPQFNDLIDRAPMLLGIVPPENQIAAGDNLNNYQTPGTYSCSPDSVATQLSNCPVTKGFKLYVYNSYGSTNPYLHQRLVTAGDEATEYFRYKSASLTTWNPWRQTYANTTVRPYEGGGTNASSLSGAKSNLGITALESAVAGKQDKLTLPLSIANGGTNRTSARWGIAHLMLGGVDAATAAPDLDQCLDPGSYYVTTATKNSPYSTFGVAFNFTNRSNETEGHISQLFLGSAGAAYRTRSGSPLVWNPWKKFAVATDLDSKQDKLTLPLSIANGGTGGTTALEALQNLSPFRYMATNIFTPETDTRDNWKPYRAGVYYFSEGGHLKDQPNTYGLLVHLSASAAGYNSNYDDQLFIANDRRIYHRHCNGALEWSNWEEVYTEASPSIPATQLGSTNVGSNLHPIYLESGVPKQAQFPYSGHYFEGIPYLTTSGVVDIGNCLDFHNTSESTNDYDVRLRISSANKNIITLPDATGTLALNTPASTSANGLMSSGDKQKLDNHVEATQAEIDACLALIGA